jgi:hypothetical protein
MLSSTWRHCLDNPLEQQTQVVASYMPTQVGYQGEMHFGHPTKIEASQVWPQVISRLETRTKEILVTGKKVSS